VAIAKRYSFVKVVQESRQGVVFARNRGFDEARGDIIGRIDVDSRIAPTWIEYIEHIFANSTIDAVSGSLGFHDAPFRRFFQGVDLFFRRYLARNLGREGELFLYGGNMALRRNVWPVIRHELCAHRELHEDIDMAAHFAGTKYRIVFDEQLRADVSVRRIDTNIRAFYTYVLANPRTYAFHGLSSRRYMYPVAWTVLVFYLPVRLLYRAYDPRKQKLSWSHFWNPSYRQRITPIA